MIRYVLRPCWAAGLGWFVVLLLCPWLSVGWQIALCVTAAIVLIVSLCVRTLRDIHIIPFLAAVCVLAVGSYWLAFHVRIRSTEPYIGQSVVLDVQVKETGQAVLLEVQNGSLPKGTQLMFYPPNRELALERYECFTASFTIESYHNDTTLTRLMRRADGVWLYATADDISEIENTRAPGNVPFLDVFVRLRNRLAASIENQLAGDIGAATAGICYGVDQRLSTTAAAAFRACGVTHLFAVSGLHMTVLLQGLMFVLARLRVHRMVRAASGLLLVGCFMTIVGFSASVVRAGAVNLLMLVGTLTKQRTEATNSLGFALLVLLLPNPFAAYDAGLLLSFSATYGLVCWSRPIQRVLLRVKTPKWLEKGYTVLAAVVAVSAAAAFATFPVLIVVFGRVSLISVPANLLVGLPAEIVLIAGCLASLFSVVGLSVLATPFMFIAGLCSRYLLWICENFSAFSFATVATPTRYLLLWTVGTVALVWVAHRFLKTHGRSAVCGICVCALCVGYFMYRGATNAVLRVGNVSENTSLAVVTSYRGGTVLVIAPRYTDVLYQARDCLQSFSVSRIDAVFILGGGESALSQVPVILGDYIADDSAIFDVSSETLQSARLGDALEVCWRDEQLTMQWDTYTLVFTTNETAEATADAIFTTGEQSLLIQTDGEYRSVSTDMVFLKNGHWYGAE